MAIVTTDNRWYERIAEIIRTHLGITDKIKPENMASAIDNVYGAGYGKGYTYGVEEGEGIGMYEGKKQGKLELLQDSKYMHANASGTVVCVNDVSPVEHEVAVKLSSDTVADLSAVTVKQYGKNLFHLQDFSSEYNSRTVDVHDGVMTITAKAAVALQGMLPEQEATANYNGLSKYPAGTYTFYAESFKSAVPHLVVMLEDGSELQIKAGVPTNVTQSFTVTKLMFSPNAQFAKGDVYTTTLQVVAGESADYEPYIEPKIYEIAPDGTASSVVSVSPSMTFIADTDGVTLDCSYLRDIDTYIDSLMVNVALTGGE